MQTSHFWCHLCQRNNPGQYAYYRDYAELENHFASDHHLCEHPDCLEKKFIVFMSAGELKRHVAKEHPEGMSKAEKKDALRLEVGFHFRRAGDERFDHLHGNRWV